MATQFVSTGRKKPQEPPKADPSRLNPTRDTIPEPEVPWGEHGIDALLWADPPPPYREPLPRAPVASCQALPGGEAV
jgi:hypothetical protein